MQCPLNPLWLPGAILGLAVVGPVAHANWSDNFDTGVPSPNWIFIDDDGAPPPNYTVVDASDGALLFEGDIAALTGGGNFDAFVAGLYGFGNAAQSFGNVLVRGTVRSSLNFNFNGQIVLGNNNSFFIARVGSGLQSYLIALDWADGSLDMERVNPGLTLTHLTDTTIAGFDPTKAYTLELLVVGNRLTGSVYDGAILVAQASAVDSTYSSGWSGIGTAINADDALGTTRTLNAAVFDDVSSITVLPGDINLDGIVDRLDAATFVQYYGRTGGSDWRLGDFNNDGRTSLADWALLKRNLTAGGGAPAALLPLEAVPEPSAWALGLASLVAAAAGRRKFAGPRQALRRAGA